MERQEQVVVRHGGTSRVRRFVSELFRNRGDSPRAYLLIAALFGVLFLGGIWKANREFAPEMYAAHGMRPIAAALSRGESYAVFDLNVNIRQLRDEQIARMPKAPDVAILGASHWQEAHADLVPHKNMFNAHVHRDYWEDMLAVSEMFVRHDRLPRQMIIAIRDKLLAPIPTRTDYLWLPAIPYYRAMAKRLGLAEEGWYATLPVVRWREQLSLNMLHTNVVRWYTAPVRPHATMETDIDTLDALLPDGSIVWSGHHRRLFTPVRARRMAREFAVTSIAAPPKIDPLAVASLDALFAYLRKQGVEITFAHPPFNPEFYNLVKGTPFQTALSKVEELTRKWAKKYDAHIIGSFDPAKVGCTARMYIDAEHSSTECLGKLLAQFNELDTGTPQPAPRAKDEPAIASLDAKVDRGARIERRVAGVEEHTVEPIEGAHIGPPTLAGHVAEGDPAPAPSLAADRGMDRKGLASLVRQLDTASPAPVSAEVGQARVRDIEPVDPIRPSYVYAPMAPETAEPASGAAHRAARIATGGHADQPSARPVVRRHAPRRARALARTWPRATTTRPPQHAPPPTKSAGLLWPGDRPDRPSTSIFAPAGR